MGQQMIDLHSHILPGIDDGARSDAESLEILKMAVDQGIDTVVVTPHYDHRYTNETSHILTQTERLQQLVLENGLKVQLLPGQEIRMYSELLVDYRLGKLLTLAHSRYLLIEFPANDIPSCTEPLFYELEMMGIKPVIAHPERNLEFLQTPEKLYRLVQRGALTQLTAGSVLGLFGKQVQKFSYQLIDADLVHVLASDVHNMEKRPFNLGEGYDLIFQKYGLEQLNYFKDNARLMVEDQTIYPRTPQEIRRKKALTLWG